MFEIKIDVTSILDAVQSSDAIVHQQNYAVHATGLHPPVSAALPKPSDASYCGYEDKRALAVGIFRFR